MIWCPACESENVGLLGILGNLAHLRCQDCGMTFSTEAENLPPEEDDLELDSRFEVDA